VGKLRHNGIVTGTLKLQQAEEGVARMGLPTLALATLLGLVAATLAEVAENKTRLCQPAPLWEINGTAPMAGALGQVTVVALLKAS
ncbi:unnamed protein product, partial [Caretta caretta]